ncbi:hypothetical protein BGX28_005950 [Mortierella sp. GBA30]|nr:hypothetical protein BGX28_005950 [Mortierella sp. GBA30]
MAICAIASRHASQSELQALAVQTQVNSKELFQHHVLFDHARALLDTYIDIPRLSTIQGLLLLAYYQIKEKRTGHFFRVRTYISLAVRMSLDMGLARSSFKDIGELDPANSGDDVLNNHTGLDASSCTRYSRGNSSCLRKKKATAIQQERRLAWLACFFLDGLSASVLGLDYCVTNVRLEMRKLVREANYTTDTTQGATLIFWYLHLDLVQIYRRICEMYRSLPQSPSSSSSGTNDHDRLVAMTSVRRGTEMLSVEHALNTWLANLPGHLAFTPTSATPSSTTADPSHAPSFYTLYLHRFYYSNMLLLYRPWITFSSSSTIEDLNDPSSAISKCAHAAQMLTEIGEVVFQNYSWPWPGCGLFAYHMLQATEIHLFLVITHQEAKLTGAKGFTDAKAQYLKTMDLIKGYLSLSKLPELDKAITALEQMVINRLAAPKGKVLPETLLSHTAYSVLQQRQHDLLKLHHQKPQLQQGDPQRDSHEYLPSDNDYNPLNVRPVSPVSQTISHLTQQQLYIEQQSQQSFTPKVEDTHMFSPLQPQVVYTAFAEGPSSMAAVPPPAAADLFHPFPLGLDISQHPAESAAEIMQQQQQSPLSSFLYDMDTSSHSLSLYTTGSTQDMFGDPDYPNACPYLQQQQQQEQQQQQLDRVPMASPPHSASHSPAVGDLIGIGIMGPPPPPSLSHTTHPSQAVVTLASSPSTPGYSTLPSIPPPKPPKRVLAQSTGSTNSSSRSQSQKPPVPKKPSRLIDLGGSGGALVSSLSFAQLHQQQPQSLRSRPSTSSLTVSSPSRTAPVSPTPQRRPIKVLQSQSRLYGPVLLKNPQKQEIGSNDHHEEIRGDGSGYDDDVRAEWSFTEAHEYGLEYIKLNPHLQCQVPPRHQPRIL